MSKIASLLLAAATPTPTTDPANTWYSPGVIGFLMTFIVVGGAILLIFDMVRRVRRVRYRAEIQEKLAAEQAAAEKKAASKATAPSAPSSKPASSAAKEKPSRPAPPPRPKRD
ncbi:MAG: hypothetical protein ACKOWE_06910 [Micrococcales bacterium]